MMIEKSESLELDLKAKNNDNKTGYQLAEAKNNDPKRTHCMFSKIMVKFQFHLSGFLEAYPMPKQKEF